MRSQRSCLVVAALAAAVLSGCNCEGILVLPGPKVDGGGGGGGGEGEDGGGGGGGGGDLDGGEDAGRPIVVDPEDPDNAAKDSDCDGLNDAEEFGTTYPGGKRTDPAKADSDGDGIKDGVELGRTSSVDTVCGFVPDADPSTTTRPTETDSDGDGIPGAIEDTNHDGRLDPGETDAANPDTDSDGLEDGVEDANFNGAVDPGETDPRLKDTDGDGINDGIEVTKTLTDPLKKDTDGDSCSDGAEDTNQNGVVDTGETNPKLATDCGPTNNPDTDGDGLPDKVEDANHNGIFEPALGETDLKSADTDGDGLSDGLEDKNKNGKADPGETNPRRKDSDCDGLIDGPTAGAVKGEDQNGNGLVEATETDPTKRDSDGDGILDGIESGVTVNPDPAGCLAFLADADPTKTTSPTNPDSDGDGIADGAEDINQNGKVDPGELNPNNATDGAGPAGKVCTAANLRPVVFRAETGPDIRLGLPSSFTEISTMTVGGSAKGIIGYDPTQKVAFIAWKQAAPAGSSNPSSDETALRATLASVGGLTNPTTQTFTTWDGIAALQAFYDQAGAADVKLRANDLANALVGPGAGALAGLGGVSGPFQLQVEYAHRSNSSLMVVVALTPKTHFVEPAIFTVGDTAGGSALAQFGDGNAVQCETFKPASSKVDFLFVVDDSCSMGSSQTALANAAAAMQTSLNNSSLDWRIGMVTTAYYLANSTENNNVVRGFTRSINQFKAWLTQNSTCSGANCTLVPSPAACNPSGGTNGGCWVSLSGTGYEQSLSSGRRAVNTLTPASATEVAGKIRDGAKLVVVLLGDADDQSTNNVQEYVDFFNNTGATAGVTKNNAAQKIVVHGVVCPVGSSCNGETQSTPQRNGTVITATGGVRGSIMDATSINTSIAQIVSSAIGAAGHKMVKPPIGASVKVALDVVQTPAGCNANDLPRSRVNGFDYDGINRTLSFFGACRPGSASLAAAVSYRYWIDNTPNVNGNPPPCSTDPYYDAADPDFCKGRRSCNIPFDVCECPSNCGGAAPPGKVCNSSVLVCDFVCTADCGGTCTGFQTCNSASCSCQCLPTATCAPGYKFQSSGGVCGCVCDTAALGCGETYEANPASCSCVCKPACGGCDAGNCNVSTCSCGGGIN